MWLIISWSVVFKSKFNPVRISAFHAVVIIAIMSDRVDTFSRWNRSNITDRYWLLTGPWEGSVAILTKHCEKRNEKTVVTLIVLTSQLIVR